MSENKLVYIASPYAGEIQKNVEFAKAACRYAMEQNCTPVAVHLLYLPSGKPVFAWGIVCWRPAMSCGSAAAGFPPAWQWNFRKPKSWVFLSERYPQNKSKEVLRWKTNMVYGRCAAPVRCAELLRAGASTAASRWSLSRWNRLKAMPSS